MTLPTSFINEDSGDAEGRALYNAIKDEAMNNMASTGYLGIQDTPKPRPTAPAGGYSTKQYNNNFATRRNVRNLFA